jgi:hypothetical protein
MGVSQAAGSRVTARQGNDMEVDALSIAALCLLFVALGATAAMRRRAERLREETRARARARRRRVPAVSANVRGLPSGGTDLWAEEVEPSTRKGPEG